MARIKILWEKVIYVFKADGIIGLLKKTGAYIKSIINNKRGEKLKGKVFKDVLFINGVDMNALPHPPRYRVLHQIEQLKASNRECDFVFYADVDLKLVRTYRTFIIYRAPYTEKLGEFINKAKELNKTVLYDVDDLVIDTKYTEQIKYLDTMSKSERETYDNGVKLMNKTLCMCDGAITTTERLAAELRRFVPKVYINRNTASEEMYNLSEKAHQNKISSPIDTDKIKLGYFSGSITHNDDFILIQSVLHDIMHKYQNVELHIVGYLDIPNELEDVKNRIIAHPFCNWRELPSLISLVDVNLAPLEENIFNEAKSENKWVEASLVRVPTVASNFGAFKTMIENDVTGLLCNDSNEWYDTLEKMIIDSNYRNCIADNAYNYCVENCTTVLTAHNLDKIIEDSFKPNIAFVLPTLNISGGVMVAFEHCKVLKNNGFDVTILHDDVDKREWVTFDGIEFPVMSTRYSKFKGRFDKVVATLWSTVSFLEKYNNIQKRYYLVQGFETNFYEPFSPLRLDANAKYSPLVDVQFLTISVWCEKWLREKYDKVARFVPNGIHTENYKGNKRSMNGKIKILVEGDCGAYYKNVDESFKITNQLDRNKFEIWYLSSDAKPKEWYKVDKFFNKVPFEEVSNIYKSCDILIKTSILESFSYPPLEMMASGGYVVALANEGNIEYLEHEKNCLFYEKGNIEKGVESILRICEDEELRDKLYRNGIECAYRHDWKSLEQSIISLYN